MAKQADVLDSLSSSLGRRDEKPNVALARRILDKKDKAGIHRLVEGLAFKQRIQNDCIKVLYEIGGEQPGWIAPFTGEFVSLLESRNNRLAWGAMTALATIATHGPEKIYPHLKQIVRACAHGSVITRDQGVNILVSLCRTKAYAGKCFSPLLQILLTCPVNQFPSYIEKCIDIFPARERKEALKIVEMRTAEITKSSAIWRIKKSIGSDVNV